MIATAPEPSSLTLFLKKFFRDIRATLVSPRTSIRSLAENDSLGYAITFYLLCHWIGAAGKWFWIRMSGKNWFEDVDAMMRNRPHWLDTQVDGYRSIRPMLEGWQFQLGSLLLDPFKSLLVLGGSAFLLLLACRLLITTRSTTLEFCAKITAFAGVTSLLGWIPFFSSFLTGFCGFLWLVFGVQSTFGVSGSRAVAVALFQYLPMLLVGVAFMALAIAILVFLGLILF